MIFDFYPWEIDVDIEGTKQLYTENNFSNNEEWNKNLVEFLNEKQREFFSSIGVDLCKISVDEKVWDINEDGSDVSLHKISADFAIKGKFLKMPKWQAEIYADKEILGELPENISIIGEEDDLSMYMIDGEKPGIVFKPPYFRVEKGYLQVWDSGYVVGSLLIIEE